MLDPLPPFAFRISLQQQKLWHARSQPQRIADSLFAGEPKHWYFGKGTKKSLQRGKRGGGGNQEPGRDETDVWLSNPDEKNQARGKQQTRDQIALGALPTETCAVLYCSAHRFFFLISTVSVKLAYLRRTNYRNSIDVRAQRPDLLAALTMVFGICSYRRKRPALVLSFLVFVLSTASSAWSRE